MRKLWRDVVRKTFFPIAVVIRKETGGLRKRAKNAGNVVRKYLEMDGKYKLLQYYQVRKGLGLGSIMINHIF